MAALCKNDKHRIKELDNSVKNRFRFAWFDKMLTISKGKREEKVSAGDTFVKLDIPGVVQCTLCMDNVKYGSRGFASLSDHMTCAKHIKLHFEKAANLRVDSMFKDYAGSHPVTDLPSTSASGSPDARQMKENLESSCTVSENMDTHIDLERQLQRAKRKRVTEKLEILAKNRKLKQ